MLQRQRNTSPLLGLLPGGRNQPGGAGLGDRMRAKEVGSVTDQHLSGLATFETELPGRRRAERSRADRRRDSDRRTVDLLRETGHPEHERRRGTERRSGRDRRRDVRRPDLERDTALPAEIFMPWQLG
jgi:hypothetical protein